MGDWSAVLSPYGVTTNLIQCPVDMAAGAASSFALYNSSYEWDPVFDDENPANPVVTEAPEAARRALPSTQTAFVSATTSKASTVERSMPTVLPPTRANVLYGDGH